MPGGGAACRYLQRPGEWQQRGPVRDQEGHGRLPAQLRDAQPEDLRLAARLFLPSGHHQGVQGTSDAHRRPGGRGGGGGNRHGGVEGVG
eukprot:scaffold1001_cov334-Prasinococcus_capsulatus_cf.AAC.4